MNLRLQNDKSACDVERIEISSAPDRSGVDWLSFDCAELGQIVRESAHRSVAQHLCEAIETDCEVVG